MSNDHHHHRHHHYHQLSLSAIIIIIITTQKRSNVPIFIVIQWPTEAFRCGMAATTTSWARAPLKPLKWIVPTNVTPELKPGKYFFFEGVFQPKLHLHFASRRTEEAQNHPENLWGLLLKSTNICGYISIIIYIYILLIDWEPALKKCLMKQHWRSAPWNMYAWLPLVQRSLVSWCMNHIWWRRIPRSLQNV